MCISRLSCATLHYIAALGMAGAIALGPAPLAQALPVTAPSPDPGWIAQQPAHSGDRQYYADEPPLGSRNIDTALEEILILLAQDEPPLGSRGATCAISPGLVGESDQLWSDRPLFVWLGQASRITLNDFTTEAELWSANLAATDTQIAYPQDPLQPGQLYSWSLTDRTNRTWTYIFQVMDGPERASLTAELAALTADLQAAGLDTQTQLAAQAQFFAEKGLWSDSIQLLRMIDSSSEVLGRTLADLTDYVCGEQAEAPE